MAIFEPGEVEAFAPLVQPPAPLLGLDLGAKTIGVASADGDQRLATGVETVRRTRFTADAARLAVLVRERGVRGLVLGLPLNMDGTEGPRCQATRAFARNLARVEALCALPVLLWDERWSTMTVERSMIEQDVSRRRRAAAVDTLAASVILQAALDRLRNVRLERSSVARRDP